MDAKDLHPEVARAFNAGDVDALVGLYEADGRLLHPDGTEARGLDAIREVWVGFVALGGRLDVTTRSAVESGDTALLSNQWTFEGGGTTASSVTAEVARRGADGAWRYVIDNPYASPADAG
jgi:uncharacterized protein (TIGR02246 family)